MSVEKITKDAAKKMEASLGSLRTEFGKVRSGRAHAGLFDQIQVDYYGTVTPLNQIANISVLDAQTLSVSPWDKQLVPIVDKTIRDSDLGLNPAVNGDTVRVPMPVLTEERRKELVKVVKAHAENCKIAIRNIRRDANTQLKTLMKAKTISEDEERDASESVQGLTDQSVLEVDKIFATKEADLLSV